jgi:hypothetical protein
MSDFTGPLLICPTCGKKYYPSDGPSCDCDWVSVTEKEEEIKMIQGWYYLHTNGDLIYKRELGGTAADIRESDFARALWPLDPNDREMAWAIIVEGLAAGANPERIKELADKWGCDNEDALMYAEYVGCVLGVDGNQKTATRKDFEDLQLSPAGFGDTYLEAMAALCKELGYKPSKMWGSTFKNLLAIREEEDETNG